MKTFPKKSGQKLKDLEPDRTAPGFARTRGDCLSKSECTVKAIQTKSSFCASSFSRILIVRNFVGLASETMHA